MGERVIGICEDCQQEKVVVIANSNSAYDWLCLSCKSWEDEKRREALDELARLSQEMGLYDD